MDSKRVIRVVGIVRSADGTVNIHLSNRAIGNFEEPAEAAYWADICGVSSPQFGEMVERYRISRISGKDAYWEM